MVTIGEVGRGRGPSPPEWKGHCARQGRVAQGAPGERGRLSRCGELPRGCVWPLSNPEVRAPGARPEAGGRGAAPRAGIGCLGNFGLLRAAPRPDTRLPALRGGSLLVALPPALPGPGRPPAPAVQRRAAGVHMCGGRGPTRVTAPPTRGRHGPARAGEQTAEQGFAGQPPTLLHKGTSLLLFKGRLRFFWLLPLPALPSDRSGTSTDSCSLDYLAPARV